MTLVTTVKQFFWGQLSGGQFSRGKFSGGESSGGQFSRCLFSRGHFFRHHYLDRPKQYNKVTWIFAIFLQQYVTFLTFSRRRPISYRNQSIDLLCKSMDWFLYDIGLRHERVKKKADL